MSVYYADKYYLSAESAAQSGDYERAAFQLQLAAEDFELLANESSTPVEARWLWQRAAESWSRLAAVAKRKQRMAEKRAESADAPNASDRRQSHATPSD